MYEDCILTASFGPRGTRTRVFCRIHKIENMVNTVSPTCILCETQATFGTFDCRKITCSKHKLPSMVHVSTKSCMRGNFEQKQIVYD